MYGNGTTIPREETGNFSIMTEINLKMYNDTTFFDFQNPLVAFPWYYDQKCLRFEIEFLTGKDKFIDLLTITKDFTGIIIELKNKDNKEVFYRDYNRATK